MLTYAGVNMWLLPWSSMIGKLLRMN